MKKVLGVLVALCLLLFPVSATPITTINLIDEQGTPVYTPSQFAPLVFLKQGGGRALFDDPYGFFANGNITERMNNYAFTGERIVWEVLVWDKNGVPEKINDVFSGWANQTNGPLPPDAQANCQFGTQLENGRNLAQAGYPNVLRPGDQTPETTFNRDTMGIYVCQLTIEPSCHGQKWFGVKAVDLDGLSGQMIEAESWFCNPSVDLGVSGNINFGELGPGEEGSSTVSISNTGEAGSGVQVVMSISGTDFYDPSSSGGLCPTTNQLKLVGDGTAFTWGWWYTATQGANSVGNKRIPYGVNDITKSDPVFSSGNGIVGNWGGSLVPMSPGSEASVTFHMGLPEPCNGAYTEGDIFLYAWTL